MEKKDKETRDFMNVETFSQLPFIRPAPPAKDKAFRLFGKEVGSITTDDQSESTETNTREEVKENENGESNRKFECHYCCRNFPTSQALGGHQNAHKRERQHAKRTQMQSAMASSGLAADASVYGLMNYRPTPAIGYHSWSNSYNNHAYSANTRFYGGHGSYTNQAPINGSPLGLWRIPTLHGSPTFTRDRSMHQLPLLSHEIKPSSATNPSAQNRLGYEMKPNVKDHVSLDLHL